MSYLGKDEKGNEKVVMISEFPEKVFPLIYFYCLLIKLIFYLFIYLFIYLLF